MMLKSFFIIIFCSYSFLSCNEKKVHLQKTLRFSLSSEIPSLDPAVSYDQVSNTIVAQVYEPLYQFHYFKRPYTIEPFIARDLPSYSKDKKTLTLKIKNNISYHQHPELPVGRKVIAQDIVNTLKRLAFIPTQSPGFWLIDGLISGINEWRTEVGNDFNKMLQTSPNGLRIISEDTLEIKLNYPSSQLLFAFTMPFTAPCPTELLKSLQKNPVTIPDFGTGAYFIESYRQGSQITLKKFSEYISSSFPKEGISENKPQEKLPFIDSIELSIIKESNSRWLKFLAQETDIESVPKDYFPKVFDESLKLKNEFAKKPWMSFLMPTLTLWWVGFNMNDDTVGADLNLRLAIAHAINTAKYREVFTSNLALPMTSIIPPMIAGHTPFNKNYEYDIAKAKEYLKKSLIVKKSKNPILEFAVRSNDSVGRQMAEFFQMELKNIGLELHIQPMPFQAFLEAQKKGQLQFFIDGWALDYPHPANMIQLLSKKNFSPGPNNTHYYHPKIEKIYNDLLAPIEDEQMLQKYVAEIQDQLYIDVPWIPLMQSRGANIIHNKVKNYNPSPVINNYFKYLDIEL